MRNIWNRVGIICLVLVALFATSCGTNNKINGWWRNTVYEASIKDVYIEADTWSGDPSAYSSVQNPLRIELAMIPRWGAYTDTIVFNITDINRITLEHPYNLWENSLITGQAQIGESPFQPQGSIIFTKITNRYEGDVCAEFYLEVPDGISYFEGQFCGHVRFSYY